MPLPIIASAVLGAVVKKSIEKAMEKVAANPAIPLAKADENKVTDAVIGVLEKDPTFINATNSEPFYQSGVAWGQAVVALGVLVPLVAHLFKIDITAEQVVQVLGSITTIAGLVYTLYRRFWPGLKPIKMGTA